MVTVVPSSPGSIVVSSISSRISGRPRPLPASLGGRHEPLSWTTIWICGQAVINIGYVTLALKFSQMPVDMQTAIELLSTKIGLVLLVLGGMHFMNMIVFSRLRRRAMREVSPPPVPPQARIPVRA